MTWISTLLLRAICSIGSPIWDMIDITRTKDSNSPRQYEIPVEQDIGSERV